MVGVANNTNNIGVLKSLEEFCKLYPEEADYARNESSGNYILLGFVPWNHECAPCWGGPWAGDHVLATITDHSNRRPMRYADALERYPVQTPNGPVVDMPTVEKPICLHLVGTDDCSYSAFFETVEQAEGMLQNILVFPMWDSLFDFGFVFTN